MGTNDEKDASTPAIVSVNLYNVPAQTLADRIDYFKLLYDMPTDAIVTVAVAGKYRDMFNSPYCTPEGRYVLVVKPIEHGSLWVYLSDILIIKPMYGIWEEVLLTTGIQRKTQ